MRQLPLFSADAEATRRLHEAYDLLYADACALRQRLERAKAAYRTLREERDQCRQERDQCRQERDQCRQERDQARRERARAQLEARHWQSLYEIALLLRPQATQPAAQSLDETLKKLLRMAHPDKWSQGQLATALAHEITVVLNDVRAQLEGHSV